MPDPRKIALADVVGPLDAADAVGKESFRDAMGFVAGIDAAFGTGDGILREEGGVKGKIGALTFGPASIFDVQAGQADTSSAADLALWDWFSNIHTGTIVADVATLTWSTDDVSRPSITLYEAAASFTLVLPTLPSELVAMGARQYRVQALVRNVGVPSITVSLAGAGIGRVPLRGTNPTAEFGDWLLITVDYRTPLGFATVTTQALGASVPPFSVKIASNRAVSATSITFSSAGFNPHIYTADEVLVFMTREVGTGITLPADKPWVYVSGGGLDVNGLVANGTSNGSRLAVATGHAEQDVGGTGTFTNSRSVSIVAYRGLDIEEFGGLAGTDNSVEYVGFTDVPDGGFAVYYTAANQATAVVPQNSVAVHDGGDAPISPGGWRYTTRRVDPAAGVIAPSPVALAANAHWHTIGVLMVPE